jgi:hypothetical protein
VPEVPLDFPRQWVEFVDPADSDQLIRADLTWLTSRNGPASSVVAARESMLIALMPAAACTARTSPKSPTASALRSGSRNSPPNCGRTTNRPSGWLDREGRRAEQDPSDRNACIFHNSEGFEGGYGCALHHLAHREDVSFIETKPEVCWQLPLRRTYEDREYEDGTERLVVVLGEYDRRGWGEGGHDFQWYCTGNTDAHIAPDPVYIGSKDEIVALIGQEAYDVLADMCAKREALLSSNPTDPALAPHPADPVP